MTHNYRTLWEDAHSMRLDSQGVCVFSHYDPNQRIEQYVFDHIREIINCGFKIIFVSTSSQICAADLKILREITDTAIIRENIGYDFGSYKIGILHAFSKSTPSRLLITNDSVFGPFHDLSTILESAATCDLFGITDSHDQSYHLQSYFIHYGEHVLQHPSFLGFWNNVQLLDGTKPDQKRLIIREYEIGGTSHFIKNGFSVGAAFPFTAVLKVVFNEFSNELESSRLTINSIIRPLYVNYNATHRYWRQLIEMGCPYLKRELLLVNPTNAEVSGWAGTVSKQSEYKIESILCALINYSGSTDIFFTTPPTVVARQMNSSGQVILSVDESLREYQGRFNIEDFRKFTFGEQRYLERYPDVKVAVMNGEVESGLTHFRSYGATEGRSPCLVRV